MSPGAGEKRRRGVWKPVWAGGRDQSGGSSGGTSKLRRPKIPSTFSGLCVYNGEAVKFSAFITAKLDRRRGLQSRLAKKLRVSRSTITAWRNGAKPEFEMCLLVAEHFGLDPVTVFGMVGEPSYESIYRVFLDQLASGKSPVVGDEGEGFREEDLYPDKDHARLHRALQVLLERGGRESEAIATVIQMAAKQLKPGEAPSVQQGAELYRALRGRRAEQVREQIETPESGADLTRDDAQSA